MMMVTVTAISKIERNPFIVVFCAILLHHAMPPLFPYCVFVDDIIILLTSLYHSADITGMYD
jgi:hypothetical protein